MAIDHPFQTLFESLGRLPVAHAEAVNRKAYERLCDILNVPVEKTGRCILLRAPRAGHGKTHLLSRVQHHLAASHEFIPLHAAVGSRIHAGTVIDDTLRRLLRPLPASGGLCVLDLVARRLFASALQPLVASGEVPCQDREGALAALRTRPVETFDFHHPNAVTAHWARENFEVLGQRLSMELAQRGGHPLREVSFWVDLMFHFAATPVENSARMRVVTEAVQTIDTADSVAMERLEALLGLLAQLMRLVLVADELEGFSTDETAALRLAAFLGSLRQGVERLDVVLSVNQDVWENAFLPRLSGGLADRLSEVVVELEPLGEQEMIAIIESRAPGLGTRILARLDRQATGGHARGLIRAAGEAWVRAASALEPVAPPAPTAMAAVPPPAPVPFVSPPPEYVPPPPPPITPGPAADPPSEPPAPESAPEVAPPSAPVEADSPAPSAPLESPAPSDPPPEPSPDSTPEPAPEPTPGPAVSEPPPVPAERTPDPTMAIAFLAEEARRANQDQPAAPPFESAKPVTAHPAPEATPAATPEPKPAAVEMVRVHIPESPPPPAPAEIEPERSAASFQAPFEPVPPLPESNQPEPVSLADGKPSAETSAPADPSPPAEPPAEASVPDTDRVDDLLRQFRERYGRGAI